MEKISGNYLAQKQTINQWSKIENPEINPCMCGQLIYNKGAKNIHEEMTVSSTNDVGETGPLCYTHTHTHTHTHTPTERSIIQP